ncbi:MAG: hypothetical protein JRC86_00015 [Deltaproteobacteria bacterium]|nr:hypothetical protein [Deltaproteobacteria bacterium]
MSKRNINKKIKPFWKDTEAISPIIATILVLAVAVAAGVGLYFWFDTFQEGAQAEVGNSTTSSMNIMIEESLGDELLKLVLPVTQFNFKSVLVDVDNDNKIYKPNSTGNYSYKQEATGTKASKIYINSWYEERFIQEIATTVTNRGPRDLTNVKIKYTELPSSLNYCLHIDRDSDWQLLDVDGIPADMTFTTSGVVEGTGMHYYFGGTNAGINYTDHGVAYADQNGKSWGNDTLKIASIYDVDGNHKYAYADNGTTYGWNTAGTLFSNDLDLNDTTYQWCKEHLHNSVYEVGDLKSGETKTVYTYFLAGYFTPKYVEGDSFADCMVNLPIEVYCDQGLGGSVTAKIHMMDLDAGDW